MAIAIRAPKAVTGSLSCAEIDCGSSIPGIRFFFCLRNAGPTAVLLGSVDRLQGLEDLIRSA